MFLEPFAFPRADGFSKARRAAFISPARKRWENEATRLSPGGAASTEDMFLFERNPRFSKQAHEFLFKVSFPVMLSLIADVALNIGDA